ncbi:OLC1v1034550C5 [Oldenlandia corymbosa var. corymbosa]|nr:OLC1v1034550C5 [Oldenlandia corymbosa var. corymbosa]
MDASDAPDGELSTDQDHADSSCYQKDAEIENEKMRCARCGCGGELLSCSGQGCHRSFHLCCVNPPFTYFPPGVWHCVWCVKRKMELGVYSVSEGIETILDAEGVSDDEENPKQYLVKYQGLAHVHNCWIEREKLRLKAPAVFSRYRKRKAVSRWKRKWTEPQQLLAKRLLIVPDQSNSSWGNPNCCHEWLVKWTGLGYDQATWELEDASFLKTPEGRKLVSDFSIRHQLKDKSKPAEESKMCKNLGRGGVLPSELTELPCGGTDHLHYVNKLLQCRYRDQNALVIDAEERIAVVVLFVLTLLKEMSGPFLIVTTSSSMWEAEFRRWAKTVNVVSYEGKRDTWDIIRTLEFYNVDGCIMFQVLLSPPIAVAEDFENLRSIKWEIIVLDDFRRPTISAQTETIKMLAANMRLLLVSSHIKDWSSNYHDALSLLEPDYEGVKRNVLEDDGNIDSSELKAKLVDFTAYERKCEAVKVTEFWVPVMLSDVQAEQYCASLLSNSVFLCSNSKCDSTFSVRDLLRTARKCCDHPYLVDRSLWNLVLQGKPASDHFDIEVQMSGKLQLLSKILPVIKNRGLRVVILFQAVTCSDGISIGDIIHEFIHQKFGINSYSRIDGGLPRHKKQSVVEAFNKKENEKFVCLIETRSCVPSIKIASIDAIIIFNSDWDPISNVKALQKITIESRLEQLKIFRLYSCYTVEEKALILAKEGAAVDSNDTNIKQTTCHKLLTWGTSSLFRRIDDSCKSSESSSSSMNSLEQNILEDVIQELSALLPARSLENASTCSSRKKGSSNVLTVKLSEGTYQGNNLYLLGELKAQSESNLSAVGELMDKPPRVFWKKLLEGREPRCRYVSSPSQRSKRKMKLVTSLFEETEVPEKAGEKSKMEASSILKQTLKRKMIIDKGLDGCHVVKKLAVDSQNSGIRRHRCVSIVANSASLGLASHSLNARMELPASPSSLVVGHEAGDQTESVEGENINPDISNNHFTESSLRRSQAPQSPCLASLQQEMERIQEAKEQAVKLHEDLKLHLESECEKEILEIRKKYDVVLHDAEAVMAEKKSALESCYQITYKQILLAEAMMQKQHDIPSAHSPGQNEVTLSTFMKNIHQVCSTVLTRTTVSPPCAPGSPPPLVENNPPDIEQCAAYNPAVPEGESRGPHMEISSPRTSLQVVGNSTSTGHPVAVPAVCRAGQSTIATSLQIVGSSTSLGQPVVVPAVCEQSSQNLASLMAPSVLERSLVASRNDLRPPSIASIRLSGSSVSKGPSRAPAPHLRTSLPCK